MRTDCDRRYKLTVTDSARKRTFMAYSADGVSSRRDSSRTFRREGLFRGVSSEEEREMARIHDAVFEDVKVQKFLRCGSKLTIEAMISKL